MALDELYDINGYRTVYLSDTDRYAVLGPTILSLFGHACSPGSSMFSSYYAKVSWNRACDDFIKVLAKTAVSSTFVIKNDAEDHFSFIIDEVRTFFSEQGLSCQLSERRCPLYFFEEKEGCAQALYFLKGYVLGCGLDISVENDDGTVVFVRTESFSFTQSLINLIRYCGIWCELSDTELNCILIKDSRCEFVDGEYVRVEDETGYVASVFSWMLDWSDFVDIDFKTLRVEKAVEDEKDQRNPKEAIVDTEKYFFIQGYKAESYSFTYDGKPHFCVISAPSDLKISEERTEEEPCKIELIKLKDIYTPDGNGGYSKSEGIDEVVEVWTNYRFFFVRGFDVNIPDTQNSVIYKRNESYYIAPTQYWCVDVGKHTIRWKIEKLVGVEGGRDKVLATENGTSLLSILGRNEGFQSGEKPTIKGGGFVYEYEDGKRHVGGDSAHQVFGRTAKGFDLPSKQDVSGIESIPETFVLFPEFSETYQMPSEPDEIAPDEDDVVSIVYSEEGGGVTDGVYPAIIESVAIKDSNWQGWSPFGEIGKELLRGEEIGKNFGISFLDGEVRIFARDLPEHNIYIEDVPGRTYYSTVFPLDCSEKTYASQQVLTSGELCTDCLIKSIGFDVEISQTEEQEKEEKIETFTRRLKIYMTKTENDGISKFVTPVETSVVYDGEFEFGKGKNYIKLSNDYKYEGGNVLLTVADATGEAVENATVSFKCRETIAESVILGGESGKQKGAFDFIVETGSEIEETNCYLGEDCETAVYGEYGSRSCSAPVQIDSNISVVQTIYTAEEIARSGTLKRIGFFFCGDRYDSIRNLTIVLSSIPSKSEYESSTDWIDSTGVGSVQKTFEDVELLNGWNYFDMGNSFLFEPESEGGSKNSLVVTVVATSYSKETGFSFIPDINKNRFMIYPTEKRQLLSYYSYYRKNEGNSLSYGDILSGGKSLPATIFGYMNKACIRLSMVG